MVTSAQADQETPLSGCCSAPGCTRKEPVHLYRTQFSSRIFAVTAARRVRSNGDGTAVFAAVHKHEITAQMVQFLRRNEAWVRGILDGNRDDDELR